MKLEKRSECLFRLTGSPSGIGESPATSNASLHCEMMTTILRINGWWMFYFGAIFIPWKILNFMGLYTASIKL